MRDEGLAGGLAVCNPWLELKEGVGREREREYEDVGR